MFLGYFIAPVFPVTVSYVIKAKWQQKNPKNKSKKTVVLLSGDLFIDYVGANTDHLSGGKKDVEDAWIHFSNRTKVVQFKILHRLISLSKCSRFKADYIIHLVLLFLFFINVWLLRAVMSCLLYPFDIHKLLKSCCSIC